MTEPTTAPGEQVQTPPQQATGSQTTPPSGYVEQARYNGLVQKVEQLTLALREKETELAQKSSENEQLKAQLGIKDTEKAVAVSERDKRLQETLQQNTTLQSELEGLRALKLKLEVANEIGHPELMQIAERLPNLTDKEALKTVLGDMAGFVDSRVKARERELMAGVTPPIGGPAAPSAPASKDAWMSHINGLPMGSKDRAKALNDYGDWLENQYKSHQ